MIGILSLIVGVAFLTLISIIDVKTYNKKNGFIPSMITTLFLIIAFLLGFSGSVYSGIFAGLIALLLTDLDFWGGIADFKVFVAGGMLFPNFVQVSIFAGFVTLFGFMYKVVMLKIVKKESVQIPFIPAILMAFIVTSSLFLLI